MVFNSIAFAIFLPVVFALYWGVLGGRRRAQNVLILAASYLFYGWWDWRFLGLVFASSLVDFLVGRRLPHAGSDRARRALMLTSLVANLGVLGFFKYFNFFIDSFADLVSLVGMQPNLPSLRIILPVGISFYTFQTLGYTIDVYKKRLEPSRDPVEFFAFVSFFPQLVAGPIERAAKLLPQFGRDRSFTYENAAKGMRQILWGLFKKVVIADNVAETVNLVFADPGSQSPVMLLVGLFLFAPQVYGDFSGYSDIAIGTARLFGFDLMRNFSFPYFARDINEFWRMWHISLTTWFRDYVFVPLSRKSLRSRHRRPRLALDFVITFTLSGLWHGANWTFVIWGLLNGLYLVPAIFRGGEAKRSAVVAEGRFLPTPREAVQMLSTFMLCMTTAVFFRATSIEDVGTYLWGMVSKPWLPLPMLGFVKYHLIIGAGMLYAEWPMRARQHGLDIGHLPRGVRWTLYMLCALAIAVLGNTGENQFIYFQF